jgi:hypothetical protein
MPAELFTIFMVFAGSGWMFAWALKIFYLDKKNKEG